MKYLLESLRQPSAWRGILFILTAGGATLAPDLQEHIIAVGMALAGAIGVFVRDPVPPAE